MDLKNSEFQDILVQCTYDTGLFCKVFMPERFPAPWTQLHKQILELIDSDERKIAIAAPRGIGKTSICIGHCAQQILFREKFFIPYVGQSQKVAQLQTENLKREMVSNRDIRQVFGSIKAGSGGEYGVDESFSKISWVAKMDEDHHGCLVLPRGAGQQIRGVLFGSKRPDLFIVDDFEDSETIQNDEVRAKWKEWFHADLVKAVSRVSKDWRIIYIDTLKHEDALIQDLLDASDWCGVRLELCNDKLESLAPEMVTDEEIRIDYEAHKEKGQLDVFFREFRNLPVAEETKSFKTEYFKSYEESQLSDIVKGGERRLRNVVLVDPAKTATMQSADSAVVGVGVDLTGRRIFVRDIVNGKFYPDELYKEMFDMVVRLRAHILGVEVTGLNEFIKQPIMTYGRTKSINPMYKWLNARKSKEERVASLVPYYRQGWIYHNSSCCTILEQQLGGFPRSKLWDVMDCFAYIIPVMDLDKNFFDPESADDDEEFLLDDESDYRELDNEEPLEGWRVY